MKLEIKNNYSINDLKEAFSSAFPGLKLEFVKHSHTSGEGSSSDEIIKGNPQLWELRKFHTEMTIELDALQKVSEVEELFKNKFGLHIQVFRKSGNVWIETVNTDNWTLSQQMERSAETQ